MDTLANTVWLSDKPDSHWFLSNMSHILSIYPTESTQLKWSQQQYNFTVTLSLCYEDALRILAFKIPEIEGETDGRYSLTILTQS